MAQQNITLQKRHYPRKQLEVPTKVLDSGTQTAVGLLADISRNGFRLITHNTVTPGEVRNFTLTLPSPGDKPHSIMLSAECVWIDKTQENACQSHTAGFLIKAIGEQDAVALNYFIRDYSVTPQTATL
ncbi:hypothetical protein CI610_02227 [invertebrate metagenome]|uniref:PilZ domain-containing protein n=1 Tax=invertebrate metagenome TaxID=1711999 RepID=A0A2H9T6I2_9ZZZZ